MLWLLMTCSYKSQHNFFVNNIYVKTILPIYLVPHLKIFPTKNNIFIWKIKEVRKIEKAEKILTKHADTQQDVLVDNFVTCFHVGQFVESPLIFHKTQNLSQTISSSLMHSLNLCAIMGEFLIFIHKLETRFLSRILAIIGSTMLIMVNWKKRRLHIKLLKICYRRVSYGK